MTYETRKTLELPDKSQFTFKPNELILKMYNYLKDYIPSMWVLREQNTIFQDGIPFISMKVAHWWPKEIRQGSTFFGVIVELKQLIDWLVHWLENILQQFL